MNLNDDVVRVYCLAVQKKHRRKIEKNILIELLFPQSRFFSSFFSLFPTILLSNEERKLYCCRFPVICGFAQ